MGESLTLGFPFTVERAGRIQASGGDDDIRGKLLQVLFTTPGERVHLPEFGCGLFNLVFEPNDEILQATVEFNIAEALSKWLADEITVDGIEVVSDGETITVEIVYTNNENLAQDGVQFQFR